MQGQGAARNTRAWPPFYSLSDNRCIWFWLNAVYNKEISYLFIIDEKTTSAQMEKVKVSFVAADDYFFKGNFKTLKLLDYSIMIEFLKYLLYIANQTTVKILQLHVQSLPIEVLSQTASVACLYSKYGCARFSCTTTWTTHPFGIVEDRLNSTQPARNVAPSIATAFQGIRGQPALRLCPGRHRHRICGH